MENAMRNRLPTRRQVLVAGTSVSLIGLCGDALAQVPQLGPQFGPQLAATPACSDEPTIRQTEGPFYKPRSPERSDLREAGTQARTIALAGFVLARDCTPMAGAIVDLWHADERGAYDDRGFRYRGHVLADAQGRFRFVTVVPALYPGRTRHFHVKVQAPGKRLLTTQLYFPDDPGNARDPMYRRELTVKLAESGRESTGRFDFVVA
jgi:protocatechuate 3,4-dioxygenase beta subunit